MCTYCIKGKNDARHLTLNTHSDQSLISRCGLSITFQSSIQYKTVQENPPFTTEITVIPMIVSTRDQWNGSQEKNRTQRRHKHAL